MENCNTGRPVEIKGRHLIDGEWVEGRKALFHRYGTVGGQTKAIVEYENGHTDFIDIVRIRFTDTLEDKRKAEEAADREKVIRCSLKHFSMNGKIFRGTIDSAEGIIKITKDSYSTFAAHVSDHNPVELECESKQSIWIERYETGTHSDFAIIHYREVEPVNTVSEDKIIGNPEDGGAFFYQKSSAPNKTEEPKKLGYINYPGLEGRIKKLSGLDTARDEAGIEIQLEEPPEKLNIEVASEEEKRVASEVLAQVINKGCCGKEDYMMLLSYSPEVARLIKEGIGILDGPLRFTEHMQICPLFIYKIYEKHCPELIPDGIDKPDSLLHKMVKNEKSTTDMYGEMILPDMPRLERPGVKERLKKVRALFGERHLSVGEIEEMLNESDLIRDLIDNFLEPKEQE